MDWFFSGPRAAPFNAQLIRLPTPHWPWLVLVGAAGSGDPHTPWVIRRVADVRR